MSSIVKGEVSFPCGKDGRGKVLGRREVGLDEVIYDPLFQLSGA